MKEPSNIYMMALWAVNPSRTPLEIGLEPFIDMAASEEEAKEIALKSALEIFPESEGWVQHRVSVSNQLHDKLKEVLGDLESLKGEIEFSECSHNI